MDAFFASVEQRDNPELRNKPIAVGYSGNRGVVATASYEARKFGIHSAMPSSVARRKCPELIFIDTNYEKYEAVSKQIYEIFQEYTDIIEPISIDEAFLDVTENKAGKLYAVHIAKEIKQKIRERLNLTASAGVSYCKFLAKIASDWKKPDGLYVIHPTKAAKFISNLDVDKIWGIGPVTTKKMHNLGIFKGEQLQNMPLQILSREFGRMGRVYHDLSNGIDNSPLEPFRQRKSVGCELTFEKDTCNTEEIYSLLNYLARNLEERLEKADFRGHTFTLKVKFHDFKQITRSLSCSCPYLYREEILSVAKEILKSIPYEANPIRLLGVCISNSIYKPKSYPNEYLQLTLDF